METSLLLVHHPRLYDRGDSVTPSATNIERWIIDLGGKRPRRSWMRGNPGGQKEQGGSWAQRRQEVECLVSLATFMSLPSFPFFFMRLFASHPPAPDFFVACRKTGLSGVDVSLALGRR